MIEWFLGGINWSMLWITIIIFILCYGWQFLVVFIASRINPKLSYYCFFSKVDYEDNIIVPVWEEIVFRGPVYALFVFGFQQEALIAAVLWGGFICGYLHKDNVRPKFVLLKATIITITAGIGIFLSCLVLMTHSLIPAIIVHSAYNSFSFVIREEK